jgi:hypothetical protein
MDGWIAISVADLRVKGKWVCLYRAVAITGRTGILKHIFLPVYRYRQLGSAA